MVAVLVVSDGAGGFLLLVASVQRLRGEGGRWVTSLYEEVDVVGGGCRCGRDCDSGDCGRRVATCASGASAG